MTSQNYRKKNTISLSFSFLSKTIDTRLGRHFPPLLPRRILSRKFDIFQAFPTYLGSNLVTTLSGLKMYDFSHFDSVKLNSLDRQTLYSFASSVKLISLALECCNNRTGCYRHNLHVQIQILHFDWLKQCQSRSCDHGHAFLLLFHSGFALLGIQAGPLWLCRNSC